MRQRHELRRERHHERHHELQQQDQGEQEEEEKEEEERCGQGFASSCAVPGEKCARWAQVKQGGGWVALGG